MAAAILQEVLIKLARTSSAMFNDEDYEECCRIVINYLCRQCGKILKENKFKNKVFEDNDDKKKYGEWIEKLEKQDDKSVKSLSRWIGACQRGTIEDVFGHFCSLNRGAEARMEGGVRLDELDVEVDKRIKYKQFFRKAELNAINKYFEGKNDTATIKGALQEDVKEWYDVEKRLYESIADIKNKYLSAKKNRDFYKFEELGVNPVFNLQAAVRDWENAFYSKDKKKLAENLKKDKGSYKLEVENNRLDELVKAVESSKISSAELVNTGISSAMNEIKCASATEKQSFVDDSNPDVKQDSIWLKSVIEASMDFIKSPAGKFLNDPLVHGSLVYQEILEKLDAGNLSAPHSGQMSEFILKHVSGLYVLNEFNSWLVKDEENIGEDADCLIVSLTDSIEAYNALLRKQKLGKEGKATSQTHKNTEYKSYDEYSIDEQMADALLLKNSEDSFDIRIPENVKDLWTSEEIGKFKDISALRRYIPVPTEIFDEEILSSRSCYALGKEVKAVKINYSELHDVMYFTLGAIKTSHKAINESKKVSRKEATEFEKLLGQYKVMACVWGWLMRNGYIKDPEYEQKDNSEQEILGRSKILKDENTVGDVVDIIKQSVILSNQDVLKNNASPYAYKIKKEFSDKNIKNPNSKELDYRYDYPIGYGNRSGSDSQQLIIGTLLPLLFSINGTQLSLLTVWNKCREYIDIMKDDCKQYWLTPTMSKAIYNATSSPNTVFLTIKDCVKSDNMNEFCFGTIDRVFDARKLHNKVDSNAPIVKICSKDEKNSDMIFVYFKTED